MLGLDSVAKFYEAWFLQTDDELQDRHNLNPKTDQTSRKIYFWGTKQRARLTLCLLLFAPDWIIVPFCAGAQDLQPFPFKYHPL
jgi:hypothetical protein